MSACDPPLEPRSMPLEPRSMLNGAAPRPTAPIDGPSFEDCCHRGTLYARGADSAAGAGSLRVARPLSNVRDGSERTGGAGSVRDTTVPPSRRSLAFGKVPVPTARLGDPEALGGCIVCWRPPDSPRALSRNWRVADRSVGSEAGRFPLKRSPRTWICRAVPAAPANLDDRIPIERFGLAGCRAAGMIETA